MFNIRTKHSLFYLVHAGLTHVALHLLAGDFQEELWMELWPP